MSSAIFASCSARAARSTASASEASPVSALAAAACASASSAATRRGSRRRAGRSRPSSPRRSPRNLRWRRRGRRPPPRARRSVRASAPARRPPGADSFSAASSRSRDAARCDSAARRRSSLAAQLDEPSVVVTQLLGPVDVLASSSRIGSISTGASMRSGATGFGAVATAGTAGARIVTGGALSAATGDASADPNPVAIRIPSRGGHHAGSRAPARPSPAPRSRVATTILPSGSPDACWSASAVGAAARRDRARAGRASRRVVLSRAVLARRRWGASSGIPSPQVWPYVSARASAEIGRSSAPVGDFS